MGSGETIQMLHELAKNLYWAWHPEVIGLFRDMDQDLWRKTNHNPAEFLSRLADKIVQERVKKMSLDTRVAQGFHQLRRYLQGEGTWGALYAGRLRIRPIAYFCAEFGLHESLPIYSGGLGILAGDHLKAASDLAVPIVGVGLFYSRGYFEQTINTDGWQQEAYPQRSLADYPMEPVRTEQGESLRVAVQTEQHEIWIEAWSVRVGRNRLLLLDTNVAGNSEADRALTANLYVGNPHLRLRQELVLGVGGMRMLEALDIRPSVVHINEGHPAFAILDLARQLMNRDGQSFSVMRDQVAEMVVFTTHTPVEAGHDRYDPGLIRQALGPLRRQLRLGESELMALGRVRPHDEHELFCMTVLGLKMSRRRNAVSHLHGGVARQMWRSLWPNLPAEFIPIQYITNGVHLRSWQAELMSDLLRERLGQDWDHRMDDPHLWDAIDEIEPAELWRVRQALRSHLVDYVRRVACAQAQRRQDSPEICQGALECLDPDVLTVVWARRFVDYKRPEFLLADMEWLQGMVQGEQAVQFVVAGKAHPNDHSAKQALQRMFLASRQPGLAGKLVFLENYDINVARHLVQGADVWLSTSRRPMEACSTSGMKAAINGGLVLSTLDGWWASAYDGANGFAIGYGTEHADRDQQDRIDLDSFHQVMQNQVRPTFYDRNGQGIPHGWIALQKRCLRELVWRYSAHRMLLDYAFGCYLPAVGSPTSSLPLDTRAQAMTIQPGSDVRHQATARRVHIAQ